MPTALIRAESSPLLGYGLEFNVKFLVVVGNHVAKHLFHFQKPDRELLDFKLPSLLH